MVAEELGTSLVIEIVSVLPGLLLGVALPIAAVQVGGGVVGGGVVGGGGAFVVGGIVGRGGRVDAVTGPGRVVVGAGATVGATVGGGTVVDGIVVDTTGVAVVEGSGGLVTLEGVVTVDVVTAASTRVLFTSGCRVIAPTIPTAKSTMTTAASMNHGRRGSAFSAGTVGLSVAALPSGRLRSTVAGAPRPRRPRRHRPLLICVV